MADPAEVVLDAATADDAGLLSNLLELYIHDLSAVFASVELGADGRFGYEKLALYWSEPERHFPFLIRWDSRVVGFALVTRGSPVSDDPNVLDVAEFFVLRRYRRSGVGRHAAMLLWTRLPGNWIVRASAGVPGAVPFWRGVVAEFTSGAATELERPGSPHGWHVFSFDSASSGPGSCYDHARRVPK
jgi:predicted acetyltransferase